MFEFDPQLILTLGQVVAVVGGVVGGTMKGVDLWLKHGEAARRKEEAREQAEERRDASRREELNLRLTELTERLERENARLSSRQSSLESTIKEYGQELDVCRQARDVALGRYEVLHDENERLKARVTLLERRL